MTNKDKLTYLALGGAGEIGMNMYLYGYGPVGKQRYLLVDTGLTFPDMESTPGVDLIMADPKFIADRADRLDGIIITHAHEDHVGGLGILYPQLKAPIYARRFTALIARQKMEREGRDGAQVHEAPVWPKTIKIGPFKVGFVPVAHSIPEASALVIDTPAGRIVHSGDFKLDKTPLVGEAYDPEVFAAIGKTGVKAFVCDSTNVFAPKPGRSEADIVKDINALMRKAKGMVVATTFASNIARLKTLAQAAHDQGRTVTVVGRAMGVMIKNGFATGVLKDFPPIVDLDEAEKVPRGKLFMLSTGSQGERRAATAQLAMQGYRGFRLEEGDTFLFSSKTIPGNEISVARILNQLSEQGVTVIDDSDGRYHVSGHANGPDMAEMHRLLQPANVIPMHGEHRHLRTHAEMASKGGFHGLIAPNGSIVDLTAEHARIIDHIETGRVYLDGKALISATDGVVRDRVRLALNGLVTVSVMLEGDSSLIDGVWVETRGLPEPKGNGDSIAEHLEAEIDAAINGASENLRDDDKALEKLVSKVVKAECSRQLSKKPEVSVMINRFDAA